MPKLLEMTFRGSKRDDERFTPAFQPHTQTRMTDPFAIELEGRHALENLNHRYDASLLKALSPRIALVLIQEFNLSIRPAEVPDDWRNAIVIPVDKVPPPPQQTRGLSGPSVSRVLLLLHGA